MSQRRYSPVVEKELIRLTKLVERRELDSRLHSIETGLEGWQEGRLSSEKVIKEIRLIVNAAESTWSDGSDPGVFVARGVAAGVLKQDDLSPEAWEAIEIFVTLADI